MKKILIFLATLTLSLSLFACTDENKGILDIKEELNGVTLKQDALVKTEYSFNQGVNSGFLTNELIVKGTSISSEDKDYAEFEFSYGNAAMSMGAKAKIYNINDGFIYGDITSNEALSEIIETGKHKFPVDTEGLPEGELEFNIDDLFTDAQFIKFLSEFNGGKITKKKKVLTIEINLTKELIIQNKQLILDMMNEAEAEYTTTEEDLDLLLATFEKLETGIKIVIDNKVLQSLRISADIKTNKDELGTFQILKGQFSLSYVAKMPEFPSFDDFVLLDIENIFPQPEWPETEWPLP